MRTVEYCDREIPIAGTPCAGANTSGWYRVETVRAAPAVRATATRAVIAGRAWMRPAAQRSAIEASESSSNLAAGPKCEARWGTSSTDPEEHTSELQSRFDLVCGLLLEKKKREVIH